MVIFNFIRNALCTVDGKQCHVYYNRKSFFNIHIFFFYLLIVGHKSNETEITKYNNTIILICYWWVIIANKVITNRL